MSVRAWVSRATGLPTFHLDGANAADTVTAPGGRVLTHTTPIFSDPLAPPSTPTTYQVGATTVTLTRVGVEHGLTTIDGRTQAAVTWIGDDPRTYDPRAGVLDTPARRGPATRYATAPASVEGTLEMLSYKEESEKIEQILNDRHPLIALHGHGRCQIPGCDVPAIRLLAVTKATSKRTGRRDRVRRDWSIDYREIPVDEQPAPDLTTPAVTWGEAQARYRTWGSVGSYLKCARDITGMPQ
jgi:hypothetical protein